MAMRSNHVDSSRADAPFPQPRGARHQKQSTTDIRQIKSKLDLASLVERHAGELRREGGYLKALCPFHKEKTPSLAIYPSRQRWQCFGCDRKGDVIDFLGHVRFNGLWDRTNSSQFKEVLAEATRIADELPTNSRFPDPLTIGNSGISPTGEKTYELRDPAGALVAYHIRVENPEGVKVSMPYKLPDGSWGLGDLPKESLPLYRSQHLASSPGATIVLTEGEKGADVLSELLPPEKYLVLGTACGSATTPGEEALRPILGREVVLVPDADEGGIAHMQRIALRLLEMGAPEGSVKILLGYDLADYREPLEKLLARKVKTVTPEMATRWREERIPEFPIPKESGNREHPGFVPVWLQPEPRPRDWIVEDLIPEGTITLLYGDAGTGKSAFATALALHVCTGSPFLGKQTIGGPVAYVDTEFDAEEFVRRSYALSRGMGLMGPPEGIYYLRTQGSLTDPAVRAQVEASWDFAPAMVILDSLTLGAYESDTKDVAAVVEILTWLEELQITALVLDHHAKPSPGANLSDYRPYGSFAKHGKGRHVLQLLAGEAGGTAVRVSKSNLAPRGLTLGFSLRWEGDQILLREEQLGSEALAGVERNLPRSMQVLIALARHPEGASAEELAKDLEMGQKTVQNHLSVLRSLGKVQQLERGRWVAK